MPVSGWRSRQEQQDIWDDTLRQEGESFTRNYVALPAAASTRPGWPSTWGRRRSHIDFIRPDFPQDGVCGNFRRVAASYGFVQRYRRDKEALTSIAEEPWHFRYVGAPHARLMEENHLCLEEYGDFVRQKPRHCRLPDARPPR